MLKKACLVVLVIQFFFNFRLVELLADARVRIDMRLDVFRHSLCLWANYNNFAPSIIALRHTNSYGNAIRKLSLAIALLAMAIRNIKSPIAFLDAIAFILPLPYLIA